VGKSRRSISHQRELNVLCARHAHRFLLCCGTISTQENRIPEDAYEDNAQADWGTGRSPCQPISAEDISPVLTRRVRRETALTSRSQWSFCCGGGTRDAAPGPSPKRKSRFAAKTLRKANDIKPWRQFSLSRLYAQDHHERTPFRAEGGYRIRAQARASAKTHSRRRRSSGQSQGSGHKWRTSFDRAHLPIRLAFFLRFADRRSL